MGHRSALLIALLLATVSAAAHADEALVTKLPVGPAQSPVTWKVHVLDKQYAFRPQGGPVPLGASEWRCQYRPVQRGSRMNAILESVNLECSLGPGRVTLMGLCGYPIDPAKPLGVQAPAHDIQDAFLSTSTSFPVLVGVECVVR